MKFKLTTFIFRDFLYDHLTTIVQIFFKSRKWLGILQEMLINEKLKSWLFPTKGALLHVVHISVPL